MNDSIQILSEKILKKEDFIEFEGPEASLIREAVLLSGLKWSSGVLPITMQITSILSQTTPFYDGVLLNKIEEAVSSVVTTAILGKELSKFLVELACGAKTVTVVYDLHNKYSIASYSNNNIKLNRKN